jgi:hypothetical protein
MSLTTLATLAANPSVIVEISDTIVTAYAKAQRAATGAKVGC